MSRRYALPAAAGLVVGTCRAAGPNASSPMADRISYVITTDGKVGYVYSDRVPDKHVESTLDFIRRQHNSVRH